MALAAEKELKHIGETCGCADHDHDLIHDLSKRLDALWRYDQYVANADLGTTRCGNAGGAPRATAIAQRRRASSGFP